MNLAYDGCSLRFFTSALQLDGLPQLDSAIFICWPFHTGSCPFLFLIFLSPSEGLSSGGSPLSFFARLPLQISPTALIVSFFVGSFPISSFRSNHLFFFLDLAFSLPDLTQPSLVPTKSYQVPFPKNVGPIILLVSPKPRGRFVHPSSLTFLLFYSP